MFDFTKLPYRNSCQVGSKCLANNLYLLEYKIKYFGRIDEKKILVAANTMDEAKEVACISGKAYDVFMTKMDIVMVKTRREDFVSPFAPEGVDQKVYNAMLNRSLEY